MRYFKNLLVVILFSGTYCSSEKRAVRHISKAVVSAGADFVCEYVNQNYCLPSITKDSIVIIRDSIKHDTVWRISTITSKPETLTVQKEKLKLQLIRQTDTIFVKAECVTDTVYREKIIYVKQEVTSRKDYTFWSKYEHYIRSVLIGLIFILLVLLLLRSFWKFLNRLL